MIVIVMTIMIVVFNGCPDCCLTLTIVDCYCYCYDCYYDLMIVVFNSCPGCRLLSHCDNRIHWPCLLFFSPINGRIQVQMQMKMNTGSNKNKSESSRQWNKYSFHKSINAIDDFILSLPLAKPAMRTVVRFIQKEGRV